MFELSNEARITNLEKKVAALEAEIHELPNKINSADIKKLKAIINYLWPEDNAEAESEEPSHEVALKPGEILVRTKESGKGMLVYAGGQEIAKSKLQKKISELNIEHFKCVED